MVISLGDMLADPGLALTPRTSHCARVGSSISWVSASELDDPAPFLRQNQILLTTALRRRSAADWSAYVRRLTSVPLAGLGVGVGNVLRAAPQALVSAAEEIGVPLFEVPRRTPFVQIDHWVAERIYSEHYRQISVAADGQDQLTRAILTGGGLASVLRHLRLLTGNAVAVIDQYGSILESCPTNRRWPPFDAIVTAAGGFDTQGLSVTRIEVEGVPIAFLCSVGTQHNLKLTAYATSLIGLEISHRQATIAGQRGLLGQVLEATFRGTIGVEESRRRLRSFGVSSKNTYTVVLATANCSTERLKYVPWNLQTTLSGGDSHRHIALLGRHLLTLVPNHEDADTTARGVAAHLATLGSAVSVGIGNPHEGVEGLRTSYFEASAAASLGNGIHRCPPLAMVTLSANTAGRPFRESCKSVIMPLLQQDAHYHSDLVETLRAYLTNNCSAIVTATQLGIHRNTLNYRLDRVQHFTGKNLSVFTDKIELWFALRLQAETTQPS